jgi:hypothetical protein
MLNQTIKLVDNVKLHSNINNTQMHAMPVQYKPNHVLAREARPGPTFC